LLCGTRIRSSCSKVKYLFWLYAFCTNAIHIVWLRRVFQRYSHCIVEKSLPEDWLPIPGRNSCFRCAMEIDAFTSLVWGLCSSTWCKNWVILRFVETLDTRRLGPNYESVYTDLGWRNSSRTTTLHSCKVVFQYPQTKLLFSTAYDSQSPRSTQLWNHTLDIMLWHYCSLVLRSGTTTVSVVWIMHHNPRWISLPKFKVLGNMFALPSLLHAYHQTSDTGTRHLVFLGSPGDQASFLKTTPWRR